MNRRVAAWLAGGILALVLGAAPAAALCFVDTACVNVPAGSSANVISGLVMAAWDIGNYDCSTSVLPNGMVVVRAIDPITFRQIEWQVGGAFSPDSNPVTTVPHAIELRPSYPPASPGVPFDLNLKVDAGPEVVLPDGTTSFGEIQVQVHTLASTPGAIPALGPIWRIVLGLGVAAAAIWFVTRRSA